MDMSRGFHNRYYGEEYSKYGCTNSSGEDFVIDEEDYYEMACANHYKLKNQNNVKKSEKKFQSSSSTDTDLICQTLEKELHKKIFSEEVNSKKYSAVKSDYTERKIRKKYICPSCDDYYYSKNESKSYYSISTNESTNYTNTLIITNRTASKALNDIDSSDDSTEGLYNFALPMVTKKVISVVNNNFDSLVSFESYESSSPKTHYKITSIRRQAEVIDQKFDEINLRIEVVFSDVYPEEIKLRLIKYFNEFFSEKENVNVVTNKNTQSTKELALTPIEQFLKLRDIRTQLKIKITKNENEIDFINEFLNLVERKNDSEILNLIAFKIPKMGNNISFSNKIDFIFSPNLSEKVATKRIIAFNKTFDKNLGEKKKYDIKIKNSSKKEKKIIKKEKIASDLAKIRNFLKSQIERNEYFLVEPFLDEFSDEEVI